MVRTGGGGICKLLTRKHGTMKGRGRVGHLLSGRFIAASIFGRVVIDGRLLPRSKFSCSWRVGYAEPATVALYCLNRLRMLAEVMQQQQMLLARATNKTQLKFGI